MWRHSLLLVLVLGSACSRTKEVEQTTEPVRSVRTMPVRRADAVQKVRLLGDVRGVHEVDVFAQLAERIQVLHVREGDSIKAGAPLATLSTQLPLSTFEQAQGALSGAELERERLAGELKRTERLFAQGAAAQAEVDRLRSGLSAAQNMVAQQKVAVRAAREQRSRGVLRAPIAGVVAQLNVQQGDMANPAVPVLRISRFDQVRVGLSVIEPDFVRLRSGMAARVRPPALPDVTRTGTVVHVAPVLDPRTRTARVEVLVDNEDGSLRPGMVARVEIELGRTPNSILVPARSVLMDPQQTRSRGAYVFVAEQGAARRVRVQLGDRYGEQLAVLEGLQGGETLIIEGQHLLRDESKVRIVEDAPGPAGAQAAGAP